ncbi:EF-P lysine aminoacylase EpmA [Endozoicomonas ascidiicola]|uniref:EF-P lysine aminoacylase EpmA n=1 Tax=Endozoicomonas ascidiicola TaxID=1698521 RepID=UPI001FE01F0E|nr:EF-P lysine aminoacylase EpmA [Endozoicomonas ascidiicola]
MTEQLWRPSASMMALRERAHLLRKIRAYFDGQGVMEVETPILSSSATVDVYIDSFASEFTPIGHDQNQLCYLRTSPEFAMKRLLASGSGDIYSLGRVFRNGEAGGRHNPEFTMLEWYRVGMTDQTLMDDMSSLLSSICNYKEVRRVGYGELFENALGINPYLASDEELGSMVGERIDAKLQGLERNDCLDLLFSKFIEPELGGISEDGLEGCFVYDYPVTMSALARESLNKKGQPVSSRFELFINGVELANGYHELTDGDEQEKRFEDERIKRQQRGYDLYPYDQHMVDALKHGMPDCAGVALGIDRLLMLLLGANNIADVLAFDFQRA